MRNATTHHRPKFGVSTSMLQGDKNAWERLLAFEPELVEFYNYPSADIPRITRFCARHGITPALHVPTPYDGAVPLRRFAPTGPDPDEARHALELTLATIRCAADIGAQHVVVHFPTPYAPHRPIPERAVGAFLDAVAAAAADRGVLVLIENLTDQPYFQSPERYAGALARYANLGFCLDVGHAHLLAPAFDAASFLERLDPYVFSAHVYNTTKARYRERGHEPIHADQVAADGWIDARSLARGLRGAAALRAVVLECGRLDEPARARALEGWRWLRAELGA